MSFLNRRHGDKDMIPAHRFFEDSDKFKLENPGLEFQAKLLEQELAEREMSQAEIAERHANISERRAAEISDQIKHDACAFIAHIDSMAFFADSTNVHPGLHKVLGKERVLLIQDSPHLARKLLEEGLQMDRGADPQEREEGPAKVNRNGKKMATQPLSSQQNYLTLRNKRF